MSQTQPSASGPSSLADIAIAVIIPCYNEGAAISKVVTDFRKALPGACIYVYDNNSRDDTAENARLAGALVRSEPLQGKGYVVRRMFSDIEADIYLLVDGDDTYDASAAPKLIEHLIFNSLDMVNGRRIKKGETAYRLGHQFGNTLLTGLVRHLFGERTQDMLSGYRAFSRRFVKSFPALSMGFEIETELTIHALELGLPIADYDTDYFDRAEGSESKLNTISDGFRILRTIARFVKDEKPLPFFTFIGFVLILVGLFLLVPVAIEYFETGLVPRFPTFIFALAIMSCAILSALCGLILDTVTRSRQEMKRLAYLSLPSIELIRQRLEKTKDA